MRVLFAGGGTGGHLYPGLAIARAMRHIAPEVDPFFIGALRGIERTVLPTTEFPHQLLDLHPLYRSRPWENWKTIRGAASAWASLGRLVAAERPAFVVGTGGYASGLALAYAVMHGIPYAIQEQNSFPGLTTRFFSRFARQVHNGFPEAAAHLHPGSRTRIFDSGNPIEPPADPRPGRAAARLAWGFSPGEGRVMLVYGGSQGSKAINDVVADWLRRGVPADLSVIWATGRNTHADYAALEGDRVRVRPYISPMSDAYAAADFALSRGGAMATAELCAWGIPPIVVPLPTAAADHQTANARALAAAGAAELIPQAALSPDSLDRSVRSLLDDSMLLDQRSRAVLARARPNAAEEIARHVLELGRE
ncbi:MAG TPA: UDP-N-acetylglucosamine--N-acetylmuramyl-(pentapeptide) pyrophosphoryl-undecaprenol N-acetylglucosamine transferase [Gemmatimonadaceae bacterium]|nr:UDP-N-acetylglucosamine--N-acetylmuramyl-(pentapeptide) pyrophosphoryl-undecaprenol N-acetylglucosamine transferase [Gemmatimonadaceae bacterium]